MFFLRCLGYVWSLPLGLIGLLLLTGAKALGWVERCHIALGVIEISLRGPLRDRMRKHEWYGHTIGWCVFYYRIPTYEEFCHEHRHVDQQLVFGVFQPALYCLFFFVLLVWYRSFEKAYELNPFEVDARRFARIEAARCRFI